MNVHPANLTVLSNITFDTLTNAPFGNTDSSRAVYQPNLILTVVQCIIIPFLFFGLLTTLGTFACCPSARTAFNSYVIFILLSEIAALTAYVFLIIYIHYGRFPLGHSFCLLYLTTAYLSSSGVAWTELLISVNRLWAVTFPHHYRQKHTKRVACSICCTVVIVSVAVLLPFLPWNTPSTNGLCMANGRRYPSYATLVAVYLNAPYGMMIVAYVLLWHKRRTRMIRRIAAGQVASPSDPDHGTSSSNRYAVTPAVTYSARNNALSPLNLQSGLQKRRRPLRNSRAGLPTRGFLVVSWIVLCSFVFWVPNLLPLFFPTYWRGSPVAGWIITWSLLGHTIETWMFMFTIPALRSKLTRCCRRPLVNGA